MNPQEERAALLAFEKNNRHYYAGFSYMGTNYTYDSPCWTAFAFNTKTERDAFLWDCKSNTCEEISRKVAFKIAGISGNYTSPGISNEGPNPILIAVPV